MKKQIVIITVSLLAALSASAQNVNENNCNHEMCRNRERTPICEMEGGVIQPEFDFVIPEAPALPEADTPILPDIGVDHETPDAPDVPETPDIPNEPVIPDKPEDEPETEEPESSLAMQVLTLVNSERAKHGLSSLTYDALLSSAASIRAVEIKSLFSHTRPDGRSCFTALDEVGYSYRKAGENIAYGQDTAQAVMTAWMNSEGHRANILGDYTFIGIGVYEKGGVIYWAQFFAS